MNESVFTSNIIRIKMKYIDIVPQIRHDMFLAMIVMSDYDVTDQMVIRITARKNDGTYMTKVIKYPETDVEYNGEIPVYFFGMSKSLIAQIIDVRINGVTVRVESTPVGDDIMARYDDSITRIPWAENMNNINLDFEVIGTNNPKSLLVVDKSEWGILADRPAAIYIKTPGVEKEVSYYLGKNQVNVFNSITLGVNCGDQKFNYLNLPDGIYDITIKGSPSTYSFNRKYLKSDSIRLNLDKVWARTNLLCDEPDEDIMEKIKLVEFFLTAAESNMRLGNFDSVEGLFEKAQRVMDIINNCDNCGCKNY